jgi:glutamate carboxypeptidase
VSDREWARGLPAVARWLEARTGAMVALTEELAAIESPSDDPEGVARAGDRLTRELEQLDFRVRRIRARGAAAHLLAMPKDRRRGAPVQLLIGHLDTVWPVGTLASVPVRREEGRLHGPGVFDMKGGLVQGLHAVAALRSVGAVLPATPVFFVNGDEETGSADSVRNLRRLARTASRALVLEPSFGPAGALKTARKGVAIYRLAFQGRAAHAGLDPGAGRSAVLALARTVERVHALARPERGLTVNVGVVAGGTRPNVVPGAARAEVDVRVRTLEDARKLDDEIRSLPSGLDGVTLEVTGGLRTPPLERTPANRRLWEAACGVAAELGLGLDETEVGGGSDGNHTSAFTATLDGLGAVGAGAHALHEHLVVQRMAERATLVAGLLWHPLT